MRFEPTATYRVQINPDCDFAATAKLIPYLAALGIDCLYCPQCSQAAPGSTHGYDVTDHSRMNEEWGGERGYAKLVAALKKHSMGQLLDVVPNHMAITGRENPWWWDVLENGPSSPFAAFFDVDWEPPERRLHNTVLLPVLADQYGVLLESHKFTVVRKGPDFVVRYEDRSFPVAPRSLYEILNTAASAAHNEELAALADALSELPSPAVTDAGSIVRRQRDKKVLYGWLERLIGENPDLAAEIDRVLAALNSDSDRLHQFLERQNYRLAYWRMAARDVGYRRFFDINSLVGLRMEDPTVFRATHTRTLKLVATGEVTGLRVDHPDGLRDPLEYFERLREACPDAWIVAEKILSTGEAIRENWPIDGTTGYDFMNMAGGLFVDPAGAEPMTELYRGFTGESVDFQTYLKAKKQLAMRESLGSDVNRLTGLFLAVCENHRLHRDYTRHECHEVLRAALACFKVYRTYVRDNGDRSTEDRRQIESAIEDAKAYRLDLDQRLFDFLRDILVRDVAGDLARELAMRFQQVSAAVMAKGVEDTAFYTFNRLIALNEVGGNPDQFGIEPRCFYEWCRRMNSRWPRTMAGTSTHDSKRGEDVRARLYLLSEIPERWGAAVQKWSAMNEPWRTGTMPDRNTEYHIYQTMVGAWPIERERMLEYARKLVREAKVYTTWTDPNQQYEDALNSYINALFDSEEFMFSLREFAQSLVEPGRINSLSMTLLKITACGVPDFYQGCELWNLTLVDPDNRRPVDFERRRKLLQSLDSLEPEKVMARGDTGAPKMWLIKRGLELRKSFSDCFTPGAAFTPIEVVGPKSGNVVAFMRGERVAAVMPRLVMGSGGDYQDTSVRLPPGRWINRLTDEEISADARVADLFARFPVALVARDGAAA